MQTLAAGAQAYQLADGVGKVADAVKNQTGQQGAVLLSVEAGFGFKTASKEQNQNYRQSRESSLKAGGDINIRSREGDITVQGSNITAGDTIRLDSARDILLLSAQDSQHQDGKNRNAGVQVGVGVSVGAQTGVYIYAEAAYGKGKNRSDSQTHQNTLLQSDKLQLSSKGNTVLNGAQAHARRIDADIGGTLYIESPQDTVEQESKQSGGGIRAQVALGTAWSVSGNYNQSKASGHSRSVGSQSGLFAGEGGYHITADSVRLKGGAIASAADKDHNELTARSFSFEDIRNESSYSASSMGIGAGYGGSLKGSDGFNQSAFGRASQTAGQNMNKGLNYSRSMKAATAKAIPAPYSAKATSPSAAKKPVPALSASIPICKTPTAAPKPYPICKTYSTNSKPLPNRLPPSTVPSAPIGATVPKRQPKSWKNNRPLTKAV